MKKLRNTNLPRPESLSIQKDNHIVNQKINDAIKNLKEEIAYKQINNKLGESSYDNNEKWVVEKLD